LAPRRQGGGEGRALALQTLPALLLQRPEQSRPVVTTTL
jgi:hypothetical protein